MSKATHSLAVFCAALLVCASPVISADQANAGSRGGHHVRPHSGGHHGGGGHHNGGHHGGGNYHGGGHHNGGHHNNHGDWNNWHYNGYYNGFGAAVVAGATVAAIGSAVNSYPSSCRSVSYNGLSYRDCGGYWLRPTYQGSQIVYVRVNPPY